VQRKFGRRLAKNCCPGACGVDAQRNCI
jgi:hypothetical protein